MCSSILIVSREFCHAVVLLLVAGEKKTKTDRRKERKVKREGKRQAGNMSHASALGSEAMQEVRAV